MTKRKKYRAEGGRECLEGKLAGEGEVWQPFIYIA